MERDVQQKKRDEARPAPPPFKLKEFENVQAKVSTRVSSLGKIGLRGTLTKDGIVEQAAPPKHPRAEEPTQYCCSNCSATGRTCENVKPGSSVNFVGRNAEQAKSTPRKVRRGLLTDLSWNVDWGSFLSSLRVN